MKSYTFALVGALTAAALSVNALEDSLLGHGAMRRHHDRANNQSLEKRAYSGHATYYNTETGNAGSCGDMLSNGAFTVAVTGTLMNSGLCGKTVTISANGKTTTARIVDTCPPGGGNCGGPDLDLSPALFQFFNPLGVGKFSINWSIGGGGGGGSSGGSSNGGGNNNNNNNNSNNDAEEKAAAAAAARKKAAEEKAQAIQDKKDAAAASSASVSAAARASSVSEVRASRASVASESRASVAEEKSASRASASAEAKASAEVVAQLKEEERTRPKNIEQFADVVNGITNMVKQAKEA